MHTQNIFDFDGLTGGNPYGSLIQAGNKLYGMTAVGGSNNKGVLFSFDPASNIYQNVKDFTYTDSANLYGNLLFAGNKLYGMTKAGERTLLSNDDRLHVSALANPTKREFVLRLKSRSSQQLQIQVSDAAGRLIEARKNVTANNLLTLGASYRAGLYFVQVIQGREKVTIKLIKE